MLSWTSVCLCGAGSIERVCAIYELSEHTKVPGGRFKIKVLESIDGEYTAVANVCFKTPEGDPDGRSGFGHSEVEALQNALRHFMEDLDKRENPGEDDFYWTNPETF